MKRKPKSKSAPKKPKPRKSQTSEDASVANFVGTWDDLAGALGKAIGGKVTRRAIQDWRTDPRYRPEIERRREQLLRADGRHSVAAWLSLMIDLGLKRGAAAAQVEVDIEDDDGEALAASIVKPPRVGGSQAQWNVAIAALDHRKKENTVLEQEGVLLQAPELEVPLGATFAAIQTKFSQFPARTARYFVGLRDVGEVEDRLRDEIDADLADIHAARFTAENAVAVAVAALPFDAESERLFQLVTFDGQDRTALLQLITAIATEALRQIGRRVIAGALREKDLLDTAIADEKTGQVTDDAATREHAQRATPDATGGAPSPAEPSSSGQTIAAGETERQTSRPGRKSERRKARSQTAIGPAEVEAAIAPSPRRAGKRRRS